MIKASIDLGTNTCLMLLAEVESGKVKKVLDDYARIFRLGEGVDQTRCLRPTAMDRTLTCLADYKRISCLDEIDNKLEELVDWRSSIPADMQMLAVAGTATTLASWHLEQKEYDAVEVEKVQLTKDDLQGMVKELKCGTVAERKDLTGIELGRADVLLAGAMIMWRTMGKLRFPICRVSSRSLRYGVLLNNELK